MPPVQIPDAFLRGAPKGAHARRLDLTKTTPSAAMSAFKERFAAVIDNFMTPEECTELLHLAESSTSTSSGTPWERAMINMGGGREAMSEDTRKSGRIIFDSPDIAQRILDRLMPFMREFNIDRVHNMPQVTGLGPPKRGETYHLAALNERLRFLRYEGGDYFRPHWDGCYVTPDGKQRSLFTIHLYLNGEGEQDMEELMPHIERSVKNNALFAKNGEVDLRDVGVEEPEPEPAPAGDHDPADTSLLGGATSFMDNYMGQDAIRVFPKTGSILIFQQRNLMHSGDDVFRGVKYTVRSDVMYTSDMD